MAAWMSRMDSGAEMAEKQAPVGTGSAEELIASGPREGDNPVSTITLHRPAIDELPFRQRLLADPATMVYNHAYGGIIDFPRERWADWYARWVEDTSGRRFYRYLYNKSEGAFVGEAAYHFDEEWNAYVCDIIVHASCRGKGYGREGLVLLCEAARANGAAKLCDNIAVDNPSVQLFLKCGFREVFRNGEYVLVEKDL